MKEVKARFKEAASIHLYSLSPSRVQVNLKLSEMKAADKPQNLHILSDCNRKTTTHYSSEDPLTVGRQYGVIQNSRVKVWFDEEDGRLKLTRAKQRRTGAQPIVAAPAAKANGRGLGLKSSSSAVKAESPTAQVKADTPARVKNGKGPQRRTSNQEEPKSTEQTRRQSTQEKKGPAKPPGLKKEQSDIFKSFSKPQPKVSRTNTESSVEATTTPTTVCCTQVSIRW